MTRRNGAAKVPSPYAVRRAAEAFELRSQGLSYRAVACQMGCSVATAFEAVEAGARLILRGHGAEEQVALMLADLDDMRTALRPKVLDGDTVAITAALRVQERRARLLGLDAPAKVNVDVQARVITVEELRVEIARAEAELAAERAVPPPAPPRELGPGLTDSNESQDE